MLAGQGGEQPLRGHRTVVAQLTGAGLDVPGATFPLLAARPLQIVGGGHNLPRSARPAGDHPCVASEWVTYAGVVAVALANKMARIAWGRLSALISTVLSLVIALPFFLTREPRNMVVQSRKCTPIALGCLLGGVLGAAAPIPAATRSRLPAMAVGEAW